MKPIAPPELIPVWIVASLSSTAGMVAHPPTTNNSTYSTQYSSLEDAQQEQMLLAIKGTKAHVFQLDFPVP